ncbi:MAG: acyl-ACP thioesterase domain-containing protein [Phycisphaerales bacterium]
MRMHDCRPDGSIKPNALMQYLQEAAACHAEELGLGFGDLDRRDGLWVLVNLRIEFAQMPRWQDHLVVCTWPSGCRRLIASREFTGCLPDGREFFRAASDWMILDKRSGRPKNLDRLDLNLPPDGPRALAAGPTRLVPAGEYATVGTLRVPFSALDFNGHVNNTEYVRWAFDAIYRKLSGLPEIHAIQLTYLAEVFEGDEIELLVSTGEDGRVWVCIRKSVNGANAFLMEMS